MEELGLESMNGPDDWLKKNGQCCGRVAPRMRVARSHGAQIPADETSAPAFAHPIRFDGWTRNGYWRDGKLLNEHGRMIYEQVKLTRRTHHKSQEAPQRAQDKRLESAALEYSEWLKRQTERLANIPVFAEMQ